MVYLGDVMFLMGWVSILLYFIKKEKYFKFLIKKIMCVWVSIFIYIEWFEKLILLKNKIFLKYNFIVFDLVRWDVLLYLLIG